MILKEKTTFLKKEIEKKEFCSLSSFSEDEFLKYFENILKNSKDIDPEFNKIVSENFWDLLL